MLSVDHQLGKNMLSGVLITARFLRVQHLLAQTIGDTRLTQHNWYASRVYCLLPIPSLRVVTTVCIQ